MKHSGNNRIDLAPASVAGPSLAIGRRTLLGGISALGATIALRPFGARAAASELVVANWGGNAAKAVTEAFGGFQQKSGLQVTVDGSGTPQGKVRAMVEAKHVIWDVIDSSFGDSIQMGDAGLLEEIDYSIVDKSKVGPGLAMKYGISNYLFSYIMAVNYKQFGDHPPKSWKDFWNVKEFPGKRMLSGLAQGVLEAALLADGVAAKDLYPLDVPRALAKVKEIKDSCVFWKTGAQIEDLLRQGEVAAGFAWSNRAVVVAKEMKGTIGWNWDQALLASSAWIVPKGNPAGKEAAMKFIDYALNPEGQAKVFEIVGMSPSNPAATALIPEADRGYVSTNPANVDKQILLQDAWYGQHGDEAQAKYLETISS
jgi:putative spermidine/putrescine transport system substrate-binding protein